MTTSATPAASPAATQSDNFLLPFQVGETAIRGRIVKLGAAIDQILARHPFEDPIKVLVGEAAALVAMMGSSLKFDGRLIFQARGDGPVSMLVSDYSAGGALRATASIGADKDFDGQASFSGLMGKGHVAITVDQGPDMERYQGVTPIEGDTLGGATISYFQQSEQIPTALKLFVGKLAAPGHGEMWRAGGIIAQFVPGEGGDRERGEAALRDLDDRDAWDRAAALLETTQADELLDPGLAAEDVLYRLYHEDGVRVFDRSPVAAQCSCTSDRITAVLKQYSKDDLRDMVEDGTISVSCEFCRTDYRFQPDGAPLTV